MRVRACKNEAREIFKQTGQVKGNWLDEGKNDVVMMVALYWYFGMLSDAAHIGVVWMDAMPDVCR